MANSREARGQYVRQQPLDELHAVHGDAAIDAVVVDAHAQLHSALHRVAANGTSRSLPMAVRWV